MLTPNSKFTPPYSPFYFGTCKFVWLFGHKNEWNNAIMWMEPETIILSEVGQTGKDKYHVKSYVWNQKLIQMNLFKDA